MNYGNLRGLCLLKSCTDIGMNYPRFLFVLGVMVLEEGRRTYSLCRIGVFSLMLLAALRSACLSHGAVKQDGFKQVTLLLMFAMRCKIFLSFLTDVPISKDKRTF